MLGYTTPRYDRMSPHDISVYRRYYCEACHHLKEGFGLVSTLVASYDMAFNTVVLDAVTASAVDFDGTPRSPICVLRRPRANSELFRRLAACTVLLAKWELVDDAHDHPSLKTNLFSLTLGRAIAEAERRLPEQDALIGEGFAELRRLEEGGCTDAVHMGTVFGRSLSRVMTDLAGTGRDGSLADMFTELAALIYVLDAIDDIDLDLASGSYNPYAEGRDGFRNRAGIMAADTYAMSGSVNRLLSSLQSAYEGVRPGMAAHTGVSDNIIYHGLPETARTVISGPGRSAPTGLMDIIRASRERNASH